MVPFFSFLEGQLYKPIPYPRHITELQCVSSTRQRLCCGRRRYGSSHKRYQHIYSSLLFYSLQTYIQFRPKSCRVSYRRRFMALESPSSAALKSYPSLFSNSPSPWLFGSTSLSGWRNGREPMPGFLAQPPPMDALRPDRRRLRWRGRSCSSSPMAMASLGGLFGGMFKGSDTGEATRKQYSSTLALINAMEAQISSLSDSQLREKTAFLQERACRGDSLDSLLPVSLSGLT